MRIELHFYGRFTVRGNATVVKWKSGMPIPRVGEDVDLQDELQEEEQPSGTVKNVIYFCDHVRVVLS